MLEEQPAEIGYSLLIRFKFTPPWSTVVDPHPYVFKDDDQALAWGERVQKAYGASYEGILYRDGQPVSASAKVSVKTALQNGRGGLQQAFAAARLTDEKAGV